MKFSLLLFSSLFCPQIQAFGSIHKPNSEAYSNARKLYEGAEVIDVVASPGDTVNVDVIEPIAAVGVGAVVAAPIIEEIVAEGWFTTKKGKKKGKGTKWRIPVPELLDELVVDDVAIAGYGRKLYEGDVIDVVATQGKKKRKGLFRRCFPSLANLFLWYFFSSCFVREMDNISRSFG